MKHCSSIFHLLCIFSLGTSRNFAGSKIAADFKIRKRNGLLSNSFHNVDLINFCASRLKSLISEIVITSDFFIFFKRSSTANPTLIFPKKANSFYLQYLFPFNSLPDLQASITLLSTINSRSCLMMAFKSK